MMVEGKYRVELFSYMKSLSINNVYVADMGKNYGREESQHAFQFTLKYKSTDSFSTIQNKLFKNIYKIKVYSIEKNANNEWEETLSETIEKPLRLYDITEEVYPESVDERSIIVKYI